MGKLNPSDHGTAAFLQTYLLHTNEVPDFNTNDFVEYYWLTPREVLHRLATTDSAKGDLPLMIRHLFKSS
jgi:hypothetical protein